MRDLNESKFGNEHVASECKKSNMTLSSVEIYCNTAEKANHVPGEETNFVLFCKKTSWSIIKALGKHVGVLRTD